MKNLIKLLVISLIIIGTSTKTLAKSGYNLVTAEPLKDSLAVFYAEQQSEEVHIHWTITADQVYNNFSIEMSTDGKEFFEIGNIKGTDYTNNTGEYLYIHKQAISVISYYRIKQMGADGVSKYTQVIKSESKKAALVSSVKIYPNPVSNLAEVSFTFTENSVYILTITDNGGRVVSTQTGTGVVGNNILQINMENQITGMYLMYITGSNGLSHVSKFIKD